jgi:menaquinone-dependent protoporphyrinogen oxidase
MRILVTYGSKMGGTAGLAQMVADDLIAGGHEAEARPAGPMSDLAEFDAVVVGGALYAMRWHKAARRFVKRHAAILKPMPVYFFSSGPLDDSAVEKSIPPTKQVAKLMTLVDGRSHATFGGRMPADAKGFPASAMAKNNAGDWRDPDHVGRWVKTILADLGAMHPVG